MPTSYSTLLGLALPATGENNNTWGTLVNSGITELLDSAIAGTTTLSTDANVTLTTTQGAANQARAAILNCTGARTATRTITAPAASKAYIVINATTGGYAVNLVGAGPTTGVSILNGTKALVAWNGSDFVLVSSGPITTSGLTMATSRLLGRTTASTGAVEEISVAGGLTLSGGTLTGAAGWTLLSTVSASTAATVELETTFDSTYDAYAIVISGLSGSTGATLRARLKQAGSYQTGAFYTYHTATLTSGAATYAASASSTDTSILIGGVGAADDFNAVLYTFVPASTAGPQKCLLYQGAQVTSSVTYYAGAADYRGSGSALTGVQFFASSGTLTGGFRLYGIKKA